MNWARWSPKTHEDLIGRAKAIYNLVAEQLRNLKALEGSQSSGAFAFSGDPGVGKTSVAMMLADNWVTENKSINYLHGPNWSGRRIKETQITDMIDNWQASQATLFDGQCKAVVINEVDKMQKHLQEMLLDWMEDYLPERTIVLVTTNKDVGQKQQIEKLSKAQQEEYLEPRFAERFVPHHIDTSSPEEIAKGLLRLPFAEMVDDTSRAKAAQFAARKCEGSIRRALQEVDKFSAAVQINIKRKEKVI